MGCHGRRRRVIAAIASWTCNLRKGAGRGPRAAIAVGKHTEVTRFYTPGVRPATVDGFRFGLIICVEINFPHLFSEYEQLGVDCLLMSAYPVDEIFHVKARAHAAINNYWISLSVPAQTAHLVPAGLIGPNGARLADIPPAGDLVVADLDRGDPQLHVALNLARPWRATARHGDICRARQVHDSRSADPTIF